MLYCFFIHTNTGISDLTFGQDGAARQPPNARKGSELRCRVQTTTATPTRACIQTELQPAPDSLTTNNFSSEFSFSLKKKSRVCNTWHSSILHRACREDPVQATQNHIARKVHVITIETLNDSHFFLVSPREPSCVESLIQTGCTSFSSSYSGAALLRDPPASLSRGSLGRGKLSRQAMQGQEIVETRGNGILLSQALLWTADQQLHLASN